MERVFVTGGAGFIGSHIIDLLVKEYGFDSRGSIVALDNGIRGRAENLDWARANGHDVTLINGDIRDRALLRSLVKDADLVFHMAALRITHCAAEPRQALEVMASASFDLLEAAVEFETKRIVAASSASVYGMAELFPTEESHHPYANRTLYGAAKVFNEGLLRSFNDMYGLSYAAMRYFNVYGQRMDIHGAYTEVLIRWMNRIAEGKPPLIFGDGSQSMDFVHVEDGARANVLAAYSDVSDEVFNVGMGVETSLSELAQVLLDVMGSDLNPSTVPNARSTRCSAACPPRPRPNGCLASRPVSDCAKGLNN